MAGYKNVKKWLTQSERRCKGLEVKSETNMKRSILTTFAMVACIGGQVAFGADVAKVGVLSFALTDTYQRYVRVNGVQSEDSAAALEDCPVTVKYETKSEKIDNKRIIKAITAALGCNFTSKAQLVIVNYENEIPAPPYPPYLVSPAANTFNGPRSLAGSTITEMFDWPNEVQIDWVEYDTANAPGDLDYDLWPKARVFISDPTNSTLACQCVEVTPFFSFEEAYCYFCYDTVDRVTSGSISRKTTIITPGTPGEPGDICLGGGSGGTDPVEGCAASGSGTTKWYMTIKFNNTNVNPQYFKWFGDSSPVNAVTGDDSATAALWFTVGGVVSYPWKYGTKDGMFNAFGTMTMSKAEGYGANPFCGVLSGSVKITESTTAKVPICSFVSSGGSK